MIVDYKKVKDALYEIRKNIKSILCDNGGMDNGYETYAEGIIEKNYSGGIDVCLPGQDITKRELKNVGYKIENYIKEHYSDIIESGLTIMVSYHHVEHGCFALSITLRIDAY